MNRIIKLIPMLVSMLLTSFLFGQIKEMSHGLSLGTHNAFVIDHPDADEKMVRKIWEDAIKDFGKVKRNKKAKEWNCLQCTFTGATKPYNIYFKIEKGEGQVTSYTFLDDGTQFVSSENDNDMATKMEGFLQSLTYDVEREVTKKDLENQEGQLKGLNKDLKKLKDKNDDYHKDIEDYRNKIKEAEQNIEKNLHEQEDKTGEIGKQQQLIEQVKEKLNNIGRG